MTVRLLIGDCRDVLPTLPANSVHCVVTSPPYFGLRDYGTAKWEGGDAACDHRKVSDAVAAIATSTLGGGKKTTGHQQEGFKAHCGHCGAVRIDSQIGLEKTPDEYVAKMVAVFREVRRVLRDDGTLWLNLGDSYTGGKQGRDDADRGQRHTDGRNPLTQGEWKTPKGKQRDVPSGMKPKDLVGIPWRVAFALQADGWVLRQEIIWQKPNPMPESVTDRCTKSHEQIFMFAKARWVGAVQPLPMRDVDAAWLAALVDGEGSICFQSRVSDGASVPTFSVRLSIVNTNRALLERITEICAIDGGPGAPSPRHRSDGQSGRPVFSWQITNTKAARVIAAIRPYLIAKATQADLALYVHHLNRKHKGSGGHTTTAEDQANKARAAEACSGLNRGLSVDLGWFRPVKPGRWVPCRYAYDADAIAEESTYSGTVTFGGPAKLARAAVNGVLPTGNEATTERRQNYATRNRRSVWTVATRPYKGAHFATFPPKLIEPCILAGTSPQACEHCAAPWERVTEKAGGMPVDEHPDDQGRMKASGEIATDTARRKQLSGARHAAWKAANPDQHIGWQPTCDCADNTGAGRCVVLDPFGGAGTTGLVADRLGRDAILIELNKEYTELGTDRITDDAPLFANVHVGNGNGHA